MSGETILEGGLVRNHDRVAADDITRRIQSLIECHLEPVARSASGWEVLYRDPDDGRLWELTYPHGDLQGGGPPTLRLIAPDEATIKFDHLNGRN